MDGYFGIHRQLLISDLWLDEPFTRGQAWVDLIGLANYRDGFIRVRGIKVDVKRGQVGWSKVRLAERWRWSRGKVNRFLKELKTVQQISAETVQQNKWLISLINIINYEKYQRGGTTKNKEDGATDGQQTDSRRTADGTVRIKNNKNNKNNNKKTSTKKDLETYLKKMIIQHNFIETKDKIFEFFNYRMDMTNNLKYKTEKGINGLFRSLNGCRQKKLIISECLEEAMEREWRTPDPNYFKSNQLGNNTYVENKNKQACEDFIKGD